MHAVKAYHGRKIQLHSFVTLALDGGEWSASLPGHCQYTLSRQLGGPQNQSRCSEEDKSLVLSRTGVQILVILPIA